MKTPRINKVIGSEAKLKCEVTGANEFDMTWSFAGGSIQSKARLNEIGDELVIPALDMKDAGSYACKVTNKHGHMKTKSSVLKVFCTKINIGASK